VTTRRATAAALDELVAQIRELPGFDEFLRPPAVRDLAAAQGHVVIVAVSRFGSHALILSADAQATAVPLPKLTPDTVLTEVGAFLDAVGDTTSRSTRTRTAGQRRMTRTLEWLWDTVAAPVLDHLGITGPPGRVLHHSDTAALAHARRAAHTSRSTDRALVVAMPHTPGHRGDLPGADAEAALVRQHFPGTVDTLTGGAATREAVLTALPEARWAHLACHGHSDMADPSSSHLLLADHMSEPLTVEDLIGLRMDVELAFLSACSTARPGGRLADESIHLASACQLAGYRHVAGAVHAATREMRDQWPAEPSIWAPHVHVGV
jgi:hypothetical protein